MAARARDIGVIAALLLVLAVAAGAIPPAVTDATDDVPDAEIDVISFDAGVLPDDSRFVPLDPPPFPPGTPVTYVWARFTFADGTPPAAAIRHVVSTSMFITDTENLGPDELHVAANTGTFGDFPECFPPEGEDCPISAFPVVGQVLEDGTLLIVACLPLSPDELRMRGAAATVGDDNTVADIDRVPDFDPASDDAEPVDVTPREPIPPPVSTTTTQPATTTVPGTATTSPATTTTAAPATTEPAVTTTRAPATTITTVPPDPADDDGGFPWWIILLLLALAGLLGGFGVLAWLRRADPCAELRLAWEKAKADCDRARENARRWRETLNEATRQREELERSREELCAEWPPACIDADPETFIELPGVPGSRLTQRDIRLREHFTAKAWEAYRADPGPDTARAAEEAWKEIDTPEFRRRMQEQDEAARSSRESIDEALENARRQEDTERAHTRDAEAAADKACDAAAELERRYRKCLAEPRRGAPKAEPPAAGPSSHPDPPAEPGSPPGGPPPVPGTTPPPGAGPCRDGDTRWEEFDGPHPFRVPIDWRRRLARSYEGERPLAVEVSVSLTLGTRRAVPYGSHREHLFLSDEDTTTYENLDEISPEAVDAAFQPMHDVFGRFAPAEAFFGIVIPAVSVMLTCERKLMCRDGVWEDTGERRCAFSEPTAATIRLNGMVKSVGLGGASKDEGDVLGEVRGLIGRAQAQSRSLFEFLEMMKRLCEDCRAGARG